MPNVARRALVSTAKASACGAGGVSAGGFVELSTGERTAAGGGDAGQLDFEIQRVEVSEFDDEFLKSDWTADTIEHGAIYVHALDGVADALGLEAEEGANAAVEGDVTAAIP